MGCGWLTPPVRGAQPVSTAHRSSPGDAWVGSFRGPAAASFLASFLACFSSRRSRTVFSRLCFAIVVLFFVLDAMRRLPSVELPARGGRASQSPCQAGKAAEPAGRHARRPAGTATTSAGLERLNVRRVGPLGAALSVVTDLCAL